MLSHKWIFACVAVCMVAAPLAAVAGDDLSPRQRSSSRRGGYSYSQADTINTYGDARGRYGAANSLRDPNLDRQTVAGPFDQGFFYDSGVGTGQHGNDSPYLH